MGIWLAILIGSMNISVAWAGSAQGGDGGTLTAKDPGVNQYRLNPKESALIQDSIAFAKEEFGADQAADLAKQISSLNWYLVNQAITISPKSEAVELAAYTKGNDVFLSRKYFDAFTAKSKNINILWEAVRATTKDEKLKKKIDELNKSVLSDSRAVGFDLLNQKRMQILKQGLAAKPKMDTSEDYAEHPVDSPLHDLPVTEDSGQSTPESSSPELD